MHRRGLWALWVLIPLVGLTVEGPAARGGSGAPLLIMGVPHVQQKEDFCGEAAAAMYLRKLGKSYTQDDVFLQTGLDPALGRGAYTKELALALQRIGFKIGRVWYGVKPKASAVASQFRALHADLARGIPSIVCMHYDDQPKTTEHFRLILGYDYRSDELIFHEPAEANGAYRRMKRTTFLKLWPLKYSSRKWTLIRMPLEVGHLRPPPRRRRRFTDADFAQHVMKLKKRLPHAGFTVVVEKPFVVIGDESAEVVRTRAKQTVRWASEHLKALYFTKDPKRILDVWLFRDKGSYERYARRLFGVKPHTPFGYYSPSDGALVMNIATGGGTLVHEIVHPFMEANFPNVPAWFNEGLGSLYEQSGQRRGRIWGFTNWRLAGLQQEIRRGGLPSFKELLGAGDDAFYRSQRGDSYAQARYLCYYLQVRGLLTKFYRRFQRNRRADPTGYKTLKAVLGVRDMKAFQRTWEAWVLTLRFPS